MAFELYINGQLVDPPRDAEVVAAFATNVLGQIQTRNGIYSNTIVLPDTNKNRLIFENAQQILSATNLPYQRLEAIIKDEGVVLVIGFAQLLSSKRGFKIQIAGGNADWFNKIGNTTLDQLDLLELNHVWRDLEVYSRRATTWEDGACYPNADYGNFTTTVSTNVTYDELFAGVYAKYLMKKLFTEAGFGVSGNFWNNNTMLPKEFLPFSSKWIRDRRYEYRNAGHWDTPNNVAAGASALDQFGDGAIHVNYYSTFLTNTLSSTHFNMLSYTGLLTVLDNVKLTFNISFTVTNTDAASQQFGFNIHYTNTNGDTTHRDILVSAATETILSGQTKSYSFTLTKSMMQTMFEFEWVLDLNPNTALSALDFEIIGYEVDETSNDYLYITPAFNYITMGSTLPSMNCIDFLRTIWNQFGIIFTTDPFTNVVSIFTLDEVQNSIVDAEDWSDKIDLSEEPEIFYELEGYSQKNYFRYETDESDIYLSQDPLYGEGFIEANDTNLPNEDELFRSNFAPIKRIDSFNGALKMGFIPKFIDGDENDPTPRICYLEFNGDNQITIGGNPLEASQPQLYFDDLRFSVLIPIYYTTLISMLVTPKVVNCLLRLKAVDIANINFKRAKYIAHFNCYFWLNEIPQYNFTNPQSTPVNIIRI